MAQKGRISDALYDGYSRYCGPTSLSAITGKGTLELCKRLRKITGRDAIKGLWNFEMLKLLESLGYKCELVYAAVGGSRKSWLASNRKPTAPNGLPMTLKKWHEENARGREVYLVQVAHHYVVIHNGQIVCTSNGGRLGPVSTNKYLRCQVKKVWKVS